MGIRVKWGTAALAAVVALAFASPALAAKPADKPPKGGGHAVSPLPAVTVVPVPVVEVATVVATAAWSDDSLADAAWSDDSLADAAWSDDSLADAAWSDDSPVD